MKKALAQTIRFSQSKLFEQLTKSSPIMLVDVGARDGIHSRWELVGENIEVLGFESDLEECNRLNRIYGGKHRYFPVALYNRTGQLEFNICKNPATPSIEVPNRILMNRFPNADDLEIVKTISVSCDTLDRISSSNNIWDVDFMKVDT